MSYTKDLYNGFFSHIYVEEQALNYDLTQKVLASFPNANVIIIKHYKDVFNRGHQDYKFQKKAQSLILAKNTGNLIFEGAPVCQDFGFDRFFYTSTAMNCCFDCDYCFLKGMYSTSNVVFFVNFEDYKNEVIKMLDAGPLYVCCSYDTDLAVFNSISGIQDNWIELCKEHKDLTIETRTKSAPTKFIPLDNVYYAFSLSPQYVIDKFERGTSSLDSRIKSINRALELNCNVRLCLDPIVYFKDYEKHYSDFCDTLISRIDFTKISDISIGTFRISKEYIKQLRSNTKDSIVTNYPFQNIDGYCCYPNELSSRMIDIVRNKLTEVFDEKRIFCN